MVVQEATDGTDALEKVKSFVPDLVFMDVRLPGTSGLVLTERIKASHPEIVVVVLTDYDLPEYREAAYHAGAHEFIPKGSLNLSDIATIVESILKDRKTGADVDGQNGKNG